MPNLKAADTAVLAIDHAVGFGNLFRSHTVDLHINNASALAKTAQLYGVPLVVTNGTDDGPNGPLFPAFAQAIGDTDVIVRGGNFNAFDTPEFAAAVEATGRKTLLISGLMTEGCVSQTALDAVRRGYDVYVVADASAGETAETHNMALRRLAADGVRPVTWLAVASEFQGTYENYETVEQFVGLMAQHSPSLGNHTAAFQAATAAASAAS